MKKKHISKNKIKWTDVRGGLNRENIVEKGTAGVSELFLSVICALLFMLAARIMLEDVYAWSSFSAGSIALAVLFVFLIGVVMQSSYFINKKIGLGIRLGVLIIGVFAFVCYWNVGNNGKHIADGLVEALRLYVADWNKYYGAAIKVSSGHFWYTQEGMDFLFLCLSLFFFWLAMFIKKNVVMVALPVLVLILELLVGWAPDEAGIILAFIAVLLSNAARWKQVDFRLVSKKRGTVYDMLKSFTWVTVGIATLLIYGIVRLTSLSASEDLVKKSKDFREWQEELIADIRNWSLFDGGTEGDSLFDGILSGNWGDTDPMMEELTNDKPSYSGEIILTMGMDYRPYGTIYLKGYYANKYEDSMWELDTDEFEDACEDNGYDVQYVSEHVAKLGMQKLLHHYNEYTAENMEAASLVSIEYANASGTRAFYPYFVEIPLGDGTMVNGEGKYTKKKNINKIFFYMWDYSPLYKDKLNMFDDYNRFEWENWYEDYVMDNYLEVPDGMSNVKNIANEILKESDIMADTVNEFRLAYANKVSGWLERNTNYSLELPHLPKGIDPVEYFLGNTKKGYCMHYASAATLILRELGVPARYVSGYVVPSSLFSNINGNFTAKIPDDKAHAWVEIYLDSIGWVPIEVTKGYNSDDDSFGNQGQNEPTTEDSSEDVTEPTTTPDDLVEQSTSEVERQDDENTSTSEPTDGATTFPDGNGGADGNTSSGNGISGATIRLLLYIVGVMSVGALAVYSVLRIRANYHRKLYRAVEKKRTLRVIKTVNRRIFRKLRLRGRILSPHPKDEVYEETLKKTYTEVSPAEWKRYMEIVKAAAFSKREFTVEEMEFCYEIYNRLGKKKKNRS